MDEKKLKLLNKVFSPSSPIRGKVFFRGRHLEISKISDAIEENGKHIILYGDRGIGKTSLANRIADEDADEDKLTIRINCTRTHNTFDMIFSQVLSKLKLEIEYNASFSSKNNLLKAIEKY